MPTVLILAASPLDQDRLSLNREVQKITRCWERSREKANWKIVSNQAATVEDLRRALLEEKPSILHFSGHGGGDQGLCFEDDRGETQMVHGGPLTTLLHHFKSHLKCVVLNACYSSIQADLITEQINYVVGMKCSVNDETAIRFSGGFYDAIFAGADCRLAFDMGYSAVALENLPDVDVPVLRVSPLLGGHELVRTSDVTEIENTILRYLNTPLEARYELTTQGASIRDAIVSRHSGDRLPQVRRVSVESKQELGNGYWVVDAREFGPGIMNRERVYVHIQDQLVKIDWEATVGYWSVPVKTFLALGGVEVVARVDAQIDNYYNYSFAEVRPIAQSVDLGAGIHGYMHRKSPFYGAFMKLLKDGRKHQVTLLLTSVDDQPQCCSIVGMLSDSWVVAKTPNVVLPSGSSSA